ncbi:GNAT family N-acetyltransferase [uncultured Paracoccus sp.]|uniref:GNAT family N-acetyltransferase n=1 Tax=uncultured Paracoccus sp. TaxID=189685 RepID=UPI002594E69C|nr:GNAT family N-acetyltransferase [uncultured Paracoccus sp.]
MSQQDRIDLEHHFVTARQVAKEDVDRLHELAIGVGWPHRPEDLRQIISLAKGYVACDEIGRVGGSALWFPFGEDAACIGMVITPPRMQSRGGGSWLVQKVLGDIGKREIFVNSTPQAIRLYEQLGFGKYGLGQQMQGYAKAPETPPPVPAGLTLRALSSMDLPALLALDREASGLDRTAVLLRMLEPAEAVLLLDQGGAAVGYAFARPFGRGALLGPVIARNDDEAIALASHFLLRHIGSYMRLDTLAPPGKFTAFVESCGLEPSTTITHMRLNPQAEGSGAVRSYAMVGQAFG